MPDLKQEQQKLYDEFTHWMLDEDRPHFFIPHWAIVEKYLTGDIGRYVPSASFFQASPEDHEVAVNELVRFWQGKMKKAENVGTAFHLFQIQLEKYTSNLIHAESVKFVKGPELTATQVTNRLDGPMTREGLAKVLLPGSANMADFLNEHIEPRPPLGPKPELLYEEERLQQLSRAIDEHMNFAIMCNIRSIRNWVKELECRLRLFEAKFCQGEKADG